MEGAGPLADARLLAIESWLDEGKLEDAQHALADIGHDDTVRHGVDYLAARLLHLRGRLDRAGLAQRLRDLIAASGGFPQASRLLAQLEPADAFARTVAESPIRTSRESRPLAPAEPPADAPHLPSKPPDPLSTPPDLALLQEPPASRDEPSGPPGLPSTPPDLPSEPPDLALPSKPPGFSSSPAGAAPPSPAAPPGASAPVLEVSSASLPASELEPSGAPGRSAPTPPYAGGSDAPRPELELPRAAAMSPMLDAPRASAIPRAPGLPRFTPPADLTPSYAPAAAHRPPSESELEPPGIPLPDLDLARPEPERIRSGFPPPQELGALPPVVELAEMLDRGEYRNVINTIDFAGAELSAEYVLMRARALVGADQDAHGRAELERLCSAPLLDPDVRAGCARLLIELGELDQAVAQARQALADDPGPPLIRLTLAWAALRRARREGDPALVGEAEEMLDGLKLRGGPKPALATALRACIQAEVGDPEHAIAAAQRAIGLDPHSVDAMAALTLASARLARVHDTQQAWLRLLEESYREADALSDRVEHLGVDLSALNPAERAQLQSAEQAAWEPLEQAVVDGRNEDVIIAFERQAQERLDKLSAHGADQDLPVIATVAANLLTTAVPWRDFAPWDVSLRSIERLAAGLDMLYGDAPRAHHDSDDRPARILLGAYLGETLREAHGGRWQGSVLDADQARVVAGDREWSPFSLLRKRIETAAPLELRHGRSMPLDDAAWAHRIPNPVSPPCPWGDARWPDKSDISRLGRALSRSVVSVWCERHAEGLLDRSIASITSVEQYLALLAPPGASLTADEAWSRRVAVLVGAYVGETLCESLGGYWDPAGEVRGPGDFRVVIDDLEAAPVERVLERLTGDATMPLTDYVSKLAHKLGH